MAFRLRWYPRHLLTIVLVAAMVLLGRWQWDVAQSERGGLQNLLYAFQWWALGLVILYGWWRLLRDDTYGRPAPGEADRVAAAPSPALVDDDWAPLSTSSADLIELQLMNLSATGESDDTDDEMREYNRYLDKLNKRSERTR
jgi:DNA-binding transcriptional regulator of glucitol operon